MTISVTSPVRLPQMVGAMEVKPDSEAVGNRFDTMIRSLADCYDQVDKVLDGSTVSVPEMIQAQKELSLLHFRLSLIAKSVDAASSLSRRLQHG